MKTYLQFIKENKENEKYSILIYKINQNYPNSERTEIDIETYEEAIKYCNELTENSNVERLYLYRIKKYPGLVDHKEKINWWASFEYLKSGNFRIKNMLGSYDDFPKYLFGLKAAYEDIILKSPNPFKMLSEIKERNIDIYNELLKIDPKIETGADLGGIGF